MNQSPPIKWHYILLLVLGGVLFVLVGSWFAEKCCRIVSRSVEQFRDWRDYQYQVKEAPGYFETAVEKGVYWLDNDRILFTGHSEEEFQRRYNAAQRPPYSLRIWNVNTNVVDHLDDVWGAHCYFGGFIRYESRDRSTKETIIKEGVLEHLTEVRTNVSYFSSEAARERQAQGELRHAFNCKTYLLSDLGPEAICLMPLLPGDGFIDATGGACKPEVREQQRQIRANSGTDFELLRKLKENPVVYYKAIGAEPLTLPIKSKEVGRTAYSEWSREYVVIAAEPKEKQRDGPWLKGFPRPIYLLDPEGRVRSVDLPWEDWHEGDPLRALPTARGLLVHLHRFGTAEEVGRRGLYLIVNRELRRVLHAFVADFSVAPDGCRVAVGVRERTRKNFGKLAVINLCTGDKP
jgi:hypothetical protein